MKKLLFVVSSLALTFGVFAPTVSKVNAVTDDYIYGDNIVPNGDFSYDKRIYALVKKAPTKGAPKGIGFWGGNSITALTEEDNKANTVLKMGGGSEQFSQCFKLLDIKSGETYEISFDYKVVGTTNNVGFAFWCTSLNNRLPEINLFDSNQNADVIFTDKDNGWKNAKVSRAFDAQTYDSMHLWADTTNAVVYFDNFTITNSAGYNIFNCGDFEGYLDYGSGSPSATADKQGIYGSNATYGSKCVNLANNGTYGFNVNGLSENLYSVDVNYNGNLASDANLVMSIASETNTQEITIIENGSFNESPITFNGVSDATSVELRYSGSATFSLNNWSIKSITYKEGVEDAISFAKKFNDDVAEPCKVPNGENFDELKPVWDNLASEYENLSVAAKNRFNTASSIDSNSDIAKMIVQYEHIIKIYPTLNNFLNKNISSSNLNINYYNTVDNLVPLIVTISLLSVTVIGSMLIIHRRKEN